VRDIRRDGSWLTVTDDPWPPGGSGIRTQLFYRHPDHGWQPPLPPDLEQPAETTRSANFAAGIERSSRPAWLLPEPKPSNWRL
jgi:hypothetical protein